MSSCPSDRAGALSLCGIHTRRGWRSGLELDEDVRVDSRAAQAAARLYFKCLFLCPIPPVAVEVLIDVVDSDVVDIDVVDMLVVETSLVVVIVSSHPFP